MNIICSSFDFWFSKYIKEELLININFLPFSHANDIESEESSIYELLFNNNYSYDVYNYYLQENSFYLGNESLYRLKTISWKAYSTCSENIENSFNLINIDAEQKLFLDKLLEYRRTNTTTLLEDYISLNNTLSKLIYVYLYLKLNNEVYSEYIENISNSNRLIEVSFEIYLNNEIFKQFK